MGELEKMASRAVHLGGIAGAELDDEIFSVEADLEKVADTKGDKLLKSKINRLRAGLCASQGYSGHQRKACETFMNGACSSADAPGGKAVPKELCNQFYSKVAQGQAVEPPAGLTFPTAADMFAGN